MATPMSDLLEEVSREPIPHPPATPEEIEEFERRVGWMLDPDLRAFYLHCNGAALLRWPDSPYEILPLSKIVRARVAICGEDDDKWGPASMYAFCIPRTWRGAGGVVRSPQRLGTLFAPDDPAHMAQPGVDK
jgi:hypothetical protein